MPNTISNHDDVIDSRDVIARLEELTDMRQPWRAGWNMPGYMPDSEPVGFSTFEDARDCIAEEIARAAEELDETEDAAEIVDHDAAAKRWEAIETEGEQGETVGKWHYWIAKVDGRDAFEDEADYDEYAAIKALADEAEGCADWEHGETLIRDSYFEDYAQELAEECAPFSRNSPEAKILEAWPYRCIDWEQAARELKMDYTSVTFDGVDYWIRS